MNAATLSEAVAVGAITGMRSMAGPALVASRYSGILKGLVGMMAAGEMVADKTSLVGDRTDPLPLTGRAVMGALVGGVIAHERHGNIVIGAIVGAGAAVIAAHLAYRLRQRLPEGTVGGLLEDAIVRGMSAAYTASARRR